MKHKTHDHMGIQYDLCRVPEVKELNKRVDPLLLAAIRKDTTKPTKVNELADDLVHSRYEN